MIVCEWSAIQWKAPAEALNKQLPSTCVLLDAVLEGALPVLKLTTSSAACLLPPI